MEAVKTNLFMSSALVRLKNNPGISFPFLPSLQDFGLAAHAFLSYAKVS